MIMNDDGGGGDDDDDDDDDDDNNNNNNNNNKINSTSIALHCRSHSQSCSNSQVSQICQSYVYSHFRTVCHWNFGCVDCSGHWVEPRNWQTHNSCHGWSTRDHSPLSTPFHCHPAGKCSLFCEHIQIWVRTISNRNCLIIFRLRLCASGRKK